MGLYQAKSVKADLYELARATPSWARRRCRPTPPGRARSVCPAPADYAARVAKLRTAEGRIENDAKVLEKVRDDAQRHGVPFGIAVIFLQISILLSSIAALLKKRPVWFLGLVVGAFGDRFPGRVLPVHLTYGSRCGVPGFVR